MKIHSILTSAIVADPDNPRRNCPPDELATLVESIRTRGLLLPLRIKPANASGVHQVVSGHRRLEASRQSGVSEVPCIIVDGLDDDASILEEQIIENMLRSNLNPIEEAKTYERYIDFRRCTAAVAGKSLSVSPARISRSLQLLALPEDLQQAVRDGRVSGDTAYNLGRLPESADRDDLIAKALRGELKRDEATRAAKPKTTPASEATPLRRITCKLSGGRALTLSAPAVVLNSLIEVLEDVLKAARRARQQGLDVSTLAKVFRDRACATEGGAA